MPLTELGDGESRFVDKDKAGKERHGPVGTSDRSAGNRRHIHQDVSDGGEGTDDTAVGRIEWAARDGEAARE